MFIKWLGVDYDTDAVAIMLAALAVERLKGDPVWLLIVSGPGNAKTETVQSCTGVGAVVTSAISSEAALLSATPNRERAADATGGLLRKLGARGVLVIKDVTSILSMNRDIRAKVLAALREVYDGHWVREVGTDGGKSIDWHGRLVVIGAVTTAWDTHHGVISTMGDRFGLVRVDSTKGRRAAGRQAIANTGSETQMRAELAEAVADVIAGMNPDPITLTDEEEEILLAAADLVTRARTGVEYDFKGEVIDVHAPEMPTRFAKQLAQIVRGAAAIGVDRREALRLAIRMARDSMPPMRLAIIDDLADHPHSTATEVRRRINRPRATVDPQLQALHILEVASLEETNYGGSNRTSWHYSLADDVNPQALRPECLPEESLHLSNSLKEENQRKGQEGQSEQVDGIPADISGNSCGGPEGPPSRDEQGRFATLEPAADSADDAYRNGLCVDCRVVPYSAGRTRCGQCHRIHSQNVVGSGDRESAVSSFLDWLTQPPVPVPPGYDNCCMCTELTDEKEPNGDGWLHIHKRCRDDFAAYAGPTEGGTHSGECRYTAEALD